jgi:hypothetical protein
MVMVLSCEARADAARFPRIVSEMTARLALTLSSLLLFVAVGAVARLSQVAVVLMRIDSVLSRKWLMRNEPDCADCL